MQIAGQKLFFPANFRFFNRLPSRFEILVIARGAETRRGTAFEIEIAGQRLVLPSRVALKPGARYELEKVSNLEFRIVSEKSTAEAEKTTEIPVRPRAAAPSVFAEQFFTPDQPPRLTELLALRVLEDAGRSLSDRGKKYVFDFDAEFPLQGLFHGTAEGGYTLFLAGAAADEQLISALNGILAELKISGIKRVEPQVFEHLATGAIDLRS